MTGVRCGVDWFVGDGQHDVAALVRREIADHLDRHAAAGSDVAGAELVCSELITNAIRHAGPTWVSLSWFDAAPTLSVADLGPGFDLSAIPPAPPESVSGRGLQIARAVAVELEARHRRGGGAVVSAVLPVTRPVPVHLDPPRRRHAGLPELDEARPGGGFGRESFLRALVVQMAQSVDELDGPAQAEAVVAQVGADIGGQMEEEFRIARGVAERLSPEELASCFVRLKHAIEGGFSVESVTAERIVLVNDRCPFGDVVRRAPALCRMTSSVFGGIAARNSDESAVVVLEERIAIGDPGCRVHVLLDPVPEHQTLGHRYRAPG
jgi:anti-sigma regulatory factor (Ser/Thr protein kinase)